MKTWNETNVKKVINSKVLKLDLKGVDLTNFCGFLVKTSTQTYCYSLFPMLLPGGGAGGDPDIEFQVHRGSSSSPPPAAAARETPEKV